MQDDENIENRRKRLIFRSWHRGTREMDLIMGTFADAQVPGMSEEQLDLFETLLDIPDPDLYDWYSGNKKLDRAYASTIMDMFLAHQFHGQL